jgi:hypothetical protein
MSLNDEITLDSPLTTILFYHQAHNHSVTVLSVRETLHLIPESEMLAIDSVSYANYKYCALKDARLQPKNAKVQFVALVASKPELTEPNILSWRVVDRSGKEIGSRCCLIFSPARI